MVVEDENSNNSNKGGIDPPDEYGLAQEDFWAEDESALDYEDDQSAIEDSPYEYQESDWNDANVQAEDTSSVEKALNGYNALSQSNADNYINSDPSRLINEERKMPDLAASKVEFENHCDIKYISDEAYYNTIVALEIIEDYSQHDIDVNHMYPILDRLFRFCKIHFDASLVEGHSGVWNGEILKVNARLSNHPLGIAAVLIHEGLHADSDLSNVGSVGHQEYIAEELTARVLEAKFIDKIQSSVQQYLGNRKMRRGNSYELLVNESLLSLLGVTPDANYSAIKRIYGKRKLEEIDGNEILDTFITADTYANSIDADWVIFAYKRFGGLKLRNALTLKLYLQVLIKKTGEKVDLVIEDLLKFMKNPESGAAISKEFKPSRLFGKDLVQQLTHRIQNPEIKKWLNK